MAKNPFVYVESVSYTKKNLMRGTENDELAEKGYEAFKANRSLSYFSDAVLFANEMNMRSHLAGKLQYEFLLNSLRKRKRYSNAKWKKVPNASVEMVMEYYGYSRSKAEQALRVLTDEQLAMIEVALDKGGKG
jgi:PP-loop superfamily ATP-utilizing enzyme